MKRFLILFIILIITACEKEKRLDVAIVSYDNSDPFISEMNEYFEEELVDLEYKIYDSDNSQIIQNQILANLAKKPPKVLICNPVDRLACYAIIKTFPSDVPIIFYNREPLISDMSIRDNVYYIGSDTNQCVELQFSLIEELLQNKDYIDKNKNGQIETIILKGEEGHQDTEIRTNALIQKLEEHYHDYIFIDKIYTCDWSYDKARLVINEYLESSNIELVISNNDNMALGAIEALEESGYFIDDNGDDLINFFDDSYVGIVGIDGITDANIAIQEGKLYGTVKNDSRAQARAAISIAKSLIDGEEVDFSEFKDVKINKNSFYFYYQKIS